MDGTVMIGNPRLAPDFRVEERDRDGGRPEIIGCEIIGEVCYWCYECPYKPHGSKDCEKHRRDSNLTTIEKPAVRPPVC